MCCRPATCHLVGTNALSRGQEIEFEKTQLSIPGGWLIQLVPGILGDRNIDLWRHHENSVPGPETALHIWKS